MSDEFEKFYEDKESNEDSKSDARVALVLVICFYQQLYGFLLSQVIQDLQHTEKK